MKNFITALSIGLSLSSLVFAQDARLNIPVSSPLVVANGEENVIFANGTYSSITIGSNASVILSGDVSTSGNFTIGENSTIQLNGNYLEVTGTATFESGAQLREGGNTSLSKFLVDGGITFKRTNNHSYSYYGSPFASGTTNLDTYGLYYNETDRTNGSYTSGWKNLPSSTVTNQYGYTRYSYTSNTITSTGRFNNADVNVPVTYTNIDSDDSKNGWNLIGNPYPSAYNLATFISDNSGTRGITAAYFWNGTNYSNTNTGSITTAQGFFVRTTSSGNVLFQRTARNFNLQSFLRESNSDNIQLSLTGNNFTDNTDLNLSAEANVNDGFDVVKDAYKLFTDAVSEIYTIADSKKLGINGLVNNDLSKVIPVGVTISKLGVYTIAAANNSNYGQLLLTDNVTGTVTDLSTQSYSFVATNTGSVENRFSLQLPAARLTAIDDNLASNTVKAFSSANNNITVQGDVESVRVLDITGNVVYNGSSKNISIANAGIYVVETYTNASKKVFKVLVQ